MQIGSQWLCYLCRHIVDDVRYFTRSWTPQEEAAFEADIVATRRAQVEAQLTKDREQRERALLSTAFYAKARKAAEEIDRFLWVELGDDLDSYEWDEAGSRWMVQKLGQLIARIERFGTTTISTGHLIDYFKSNLRPPEDFTAVRAEFERVMQQYAATFKEESHEERNER